MIGMPILDVAIGLSFIYLLLALICSALNETIAGFTQRRAAMLKEGIGRLLQDAGLRDRLYQHPLIRGLGASDDKPPSYIPGRTFALALMDIVRTAGEAVPSMGKGDLQRVLQALVSEAPNIRKAFAPGGTADDAAAALKTIEAWYDNHMDRVSGWYKRHAQVWILGLALAVTVVTNADTVRMTRTLWLNPTVRNAVVEAAKARAQMERPEEMVPLVTYPNPDKPTAGKPVGVNQGALTDAERATLGQILGWSYDLKEAHAPSELQWWKFAFQGKFWSWVGTQEFWGWLPPHVIGWLLTVIAISLGAPFWFDTLNRFINIRNAGRAPDERRDKSQPAAGGGQTS